MENGPQGVMSLRATRLHCAGVRSDFIRVRDIVLFIKQEVLLWYHSLSVSTMFRTRFKKEIVCEFLPPAFASPSRSATAEQRKATAGKPFRTSSKVIILAHGMPGAPKAKEVMEFWSQKGFWVFFPRYRGTWESGGEFLKDSPEKDILDVIDVIQKGFTDLWSGRRYRLSVVGCKFFIFGGSFGGPAAILCSRDPRVTKAVAFAPVIDWEAPSDEPMGELGAFLPKGFGNCYRFSKKNWNRLSRNEFYSPIREMGTIVGRKLLLVHAKDDTSVPYSYTKKFATKTGSKLITLRTGGHFGFSKSIEPKVYKEIREFLS